MNKFEAEQRRIAELKKELEALKEANK